MSTGRKKGTGLGALALHDVASEMMRYRLEETQIDVPAALRHGGQLMPLGRYMQQNLRRLVGKDEKAPKEAVDQGAQRLQIVRSFAFDNSRSVKSVFKELNQPIADQLAAKAQMKERKL